MKREQLNLTEADGYAALKGHVFERALAARERHGPDFDEATLRALLADPETVRFPTTLEFGKAELLGGEFAWARPNGARSSDGFTLVVHECFEGRWDVLPLLIAYHIVSINYLDVATNEEAELYGATLLGLEVDAYYEQLCVLADSVPGAPVFDPELVAKFEEAEAGLSRVTSGGGCGSSCSGSCGSQ